LGIELGLLEFISSGIYEREESKDNEGVKRQTTLFLIPFKKMKVNQVVD